MIQMIKGLGVDIVEIKRIEAAVNRNERFLTKLFSEDERAYFESSGKRMETVAGNFAAKEAVAKVFGTGIRNFNWVDIEVLRDDMGKPYVRLKDEAKKLSDQLGIIKIEVSISHCKEYAVANAIGY